MSGGPLLALPLGTIRPHSRKVLIGEDLAYVTAGDADCHQFTCLGLVRFLAAIFDRPIPAVQQLDEADSCLLAKIDLALTAADVGFRLWRVVSLQAQLSPGEPERVAVDDTAR